MRFECLDAAFALMIYLKISTTAIFKAYVNFAFISFMSIGTMLILFTYGSNVGMCGKSTIN